MRLALATRWLPAGTRLEAAVEVVRGLGLAHLALDLPGPVAPGAREALRTYGVEAAAVLLREGSGAAAEHDTRFGQAVGHAAKVASRLRAPWVVVEGGTLGGRVERELRQDEQTRKVAALGAGAPAGTAAPSRRGAAEAAAERALRALHAPLQAGVPLALRPGGAAADLLGFEETAWVLEDLPGLGLFLDPTRALRLQRLGLGPSPAEWAERFASRTGGVFAHGLGPALAGGGHPNEDGPPWDILGDILPRGAVRVLDLDPDLPRSDVLDAIRFLLSRRGA